jgi:GNAT superfamily N-acetyltransferase
VSYVIRAVTPDLWPSLEDLFEKRGASNGCWCMYWRIGPEYRRRPRDKNRLALRQLVRRGPPPGLLAFDGAKPVGWCQLTPRADLSWLDSRPPLARVDSVPVWAISCFFVRRSYRRKGVMSALIAAAVKVAKRAGAPALEAYPYDDGAEPGCAYTGYASTFARAGFEEIARRTASRPIMRRTFRARVPRSAP